MICIVGGIAFLFPIHALDLILQLQNHNIAHKLSSYFMDFNCITFNFDYIEYSIFTSTNDTTKALLPIYDLILLPFSDHAPIQHVDYSLHYSQFQQIIPRSSQKMHSNLTFCNHESFTGFTQRRGGQRYVCTTHSPSAGL